MASYLASPALQQNNRGSVPNGIRLRALGQFPRSRCPTQPARKDVPRPFGGSSAWLREGLRWLILMPFGSVPVFAYLRANGNTTRTYASPDPNGAKNASGGPADAYFTAIGVCHRNLHPAAVLNRYPFGSMRKGAIGNSGDTILISHCPFLGRPPLGGARNRPRGRPPPEKRCCSVTAPR